MGRAKGRKQNSNSCPPHDFQDDRTRREITEGEQIIYHFQTCTKCNRKNVEIERTGRSNGHR